MKGGKDATRPRLLRILDKELYLRIQKRNSRFETCAKAQSE